MKENTTYRRARDAFFLLSEEKDFDNISITDITVRSRMSRQNFYKNFESRNDLIHEIFVDDICKAINCSVIFNAELTIKKAAEIFLRHKSFYLGIIYSSSSQYIYTMILDYCIYLCDSPSTYAGYRQLTDEQKDILRLYISGCINTLFSFLKEEKPDSAKLSGIILKSLPGKLNECIKLNTLTSEFMVYKAKKFKENWYYE